MAGGLRLKLGLRLGLGLGLELGPRLGLGLRLGLLRSIRNTLLAWKLRQDQRVICVERTNARKMDPGAAKTPGK